MLSQRQRPVAYAISAGVLVWLLAWGGYTAAKHSKTTAEKVRAYLHKVDLHSLTGEARAKALRKLADQLNALPPEERRNARLDREWNRWFTEMTDQEKSDFLDATLPSGFKQMLTAFEELPADKRKKAVEDALKRLKEASDDPSIREQWQAEGETPPPQMSEELQKKVAVAGLKSFYSQSSAQAKAELAPLLEELQRAMESGRLFRGGPRQ